MFCLINFYFSQTPPLPSLFLLSLRLRSTIGDGTAYRPDLQLGGGRRLRRGSITDPHHRKWGRKLRRRKFTDQICSSPMFGRRSRRWEAIALQISTVTDLHHQRCDRKLHRHEFPVIAVARRLNGREVREREGWGELIVAVIGRGKREKRREKKLYLYLFLTINQWFTHSESLIIISDWL